MVNARAPTSRLTERNSLQTRRQLHRRGAQRGFACTLHLPGVSFAVPSSKAADHAARRPEARRRAQNRAALDGCRYLYEIGVLDERLHVAGRAEALAKLRQAAGAPRSRRAENSRYLHMGEPAVRRRRRASFRPPTARCADGGRILCSSTTARRSLRCSFRRSAARHIIHAGCRRVDARTAAAVPPRPILVEPSEAELEELVRSRGTVRPRPGGFRGRAAPPAPPGASPTPPLQPQQLGRLPPEESLDPQRPSLRLQVPPPIRCCPPAEAWRRSSIRTLLPSRSCCGRS